MAHRLFVLTDIENEPDDTQSLVRLLLYSNEIDIEGIVAVTSTWLRFAVHPEAIFRVLDGYEKARPLLLKHDSKYPSADHLRTLVRSGVVAYGMDGVGEGKDSGGSDLLIETVDKDDPRPVHVAFWGGANCLAQALWKVRHTRTAEQLAAFVGKLRVYAISDQDHAGPWIRRHFPMLQFVVSVHGENAYMSATWIGGPADGTRSHDPRPLAEPEFVMKPWLKEHIQYGPLGSEYPDTAFGMEGDTPSYLNLIPTGLADPNRPEYGGWGGRYSRSMDLEALHYHDCFDIVPLPNGGHTKPSGQASIWRWRDAYQRDFASRMRWTVEEDLSKTQHPPIAIINGDATQDFIRIAAKCNDVLEFDASESRSPEGHPLEFWWCMYKEIGTVIPPFETFDMHGTNKSNKLKITMPKTTAQPINDRVDFTESRDYHVILQVTSKGGEFPLTRYRRIIIHVENIK